MKTLKELQKFYATTMFKSGKSDSKGVSGTSFLLVFFFFFFFFFLQIYTFFVLLFTVSMHYLALF